MTFENWTLDQPEEETRRCASFKMQWNGIEFNNLTRLDLMDRLEAPASLEWSPSPYGESSFMVLLDNGSLFCLSIPDSLDTHTYSSRVHSWTSTFDAIDTHANLDRWSVPVVYRVWSGMVSVYVLEYKETAYYKYTPEFPDILLPIDSQGIPFPLVILILLCVIFIAVFQYSRSESGKRSLEKIPKPLLDRLHVFATVLIFLFYVNLYIIVMSPIDIYSQLSFGIVLLFIVGIAIRVYNAVSQPEEDSEESEEEESKYDS